MLVAASSHRLQPLLEFGLHTGLRKGEMLGLRWGDLELAEGIVSIRHTLQHTNSGGLSALKRVKYPAGEQSSGAFH
ncbi:hypothetical protein ACFQ7N_04155 [Streptomyces niveus]|uniref:hypothetical protein n=1 Tax=Streptomyces niveus TaxID=193462 RepID=UPI0036746C5A